jgi:hypothetical protein
MVKLTDKENRKMRIKRIEKEIRDTPYHKATEHHIGRLRAKLSKLKAEDLEKSAKKGGGGEGYAVKKQGDATVTLVGPPSVGKSTLLNKLTNARSKIAPYEFTTISVVPGMMEYRDAKIQVLDVPGLIGGAEEGRGRGKEVLSVIRGSDLLIIMCDVDNVGEFDKITETLENSGIRINKTPPNVTIDKKVRGGIRIYSNIKQDVSDKTIKDIAKEFRIRNADITIKEKLSTDTLIDAFSSNRVYIPALFVINKIDKGNIEKQKEKKLENIENVLKISAERQQGIKRLKKEIFRHLRLVRVYLVKEGDKPTTDNPLIVKKGTTLKKVAEIIGEEFAEDKKGARIWGSSAKFPGQEVSLSTKVKDAMKIKFI